MTVPTEQVLDTWAIHQRILLRLLELLPAEALGAVAPSGGRSVALQFAHLHAVRCDWVQACAPQFAESLHKLPVKSNADKLALTQPILAQALTHSAEAVGQMLAWAFERGKLPNFKPHPSAFLGYLLTHEGYHRGEIGIILTQAGYPLAEQDAYALWDWGKFQSP